MSGTAHIGKTIFISYSRKDSAFAETLKNDLRAAGATIWIDHERLAPGHPDWQAAIRRGIAAAHVFIYVASPDAEQSVYVRAEVRIAQEDARANQSLAIIPVWTRGDSWSRCAPFELIPAHYLDARGVKYSTARADLFKRLGLAAQQEPMPPALATLPSAVRVTPSPGVVVDHDVAHVTHAYDVSPGGCGAPIYFLPVYVLLDCSAGMRGAPLDSLRELMQLLYDEIMSDHEARSKVRFSLITFASDAQQTQMVPIADFTPPMIQAGGVTRLDGALHLLADSIEQDVRLRTLHARGDYRPVVFLLLGSNPTDEHGYPSKLYQAELSRLRAFRHNHKPTIVAIQCGPDVDVGILMEITPDTLPIQDVSGTRLREYFLYIDDYHGD